MAKQKEAKLLLLSVHIDATLLTRFKAIAKAIGITQQIAADEALQSWVNNNVHEASEVLLGEADV